MVFVYSLTCRGTLCRGVNKSHSFTKGRVDKSYTATHRGEDKSYTASQMGVDKSYTASHRGVDKSLYKGTEAWTSFT